jgi:hypothetical protein
MNRYLKLVSVCVVILAFLSVLKGAQTDSSFKSIHQLELEKHQKDTTLPDTIAQTAPAESVMTPETQVRAAINLSLLLVITIILIAAIAIYFIVRSMSHSQRE